jgi:fido (protein-threonine AMPylation protein)
MTEDFDKYYEAVEPDRRERAYAWATAIGLQDVDGLKPSKYLVSTAKRHIEGEISQDEARRLVDEYYETKEGHDLPADVQEADKVSARIVAVINSPTFNFSVPYYLGLHRQIFDGVFKFAGEVRSVELTKREWVLNGDTVQYTPSCMIKDTLEYDFDRERKFKYTGLSEDAFIEHFTTFISGIWQIHPFREGNTRTVALFAIKYLRSLGYQASNDLFAAKSWYFRNALVRANYENVRLQIEKTQLPLEEFFKVLLFGYEIELKNRYLRIGQEYGTKTAEAVTGLHRSDVGIMSLDVGINDVIKRSDDVINDVIKFNATEEVAIKAFLHDSRLSAGRLADIIGVKQRQAQRIIDSLKKKAGLKRRGARKNGEWYFEK